MPEEDARALLAAFGIAAAPTMRVETLAEAQAAARKLKYPVALMLEGVEPLQARAGIANRHALARAYGELLADAPKGRGGAWTGQVIVRRTPPSGMSGGCAIALSVDPVFGPVIVASETPRQLPVAQAKNVMLPPLNRRLAGDLLTGALRGRPHERLVDTLLRVSAMACALPWLREVVLDPIVVTGDRAEIAAARIVADPRRMPAPGYRHMAIHPYPVELESRFKLADGIEIIVRPVKPEDADLERRFVAGLSEQTRFFRFFYRLNELTPAMLARFTQVDYDRELALLALAADPEAAAGVSMVGIARYIANPDHESGEFAVVVADAWQGRGIAGRLMKTLIACARKKGLRCLVGTVLRVNHNMLRFSRDLGFEVRDDPEDPEQVSVRLHLQ